MVEPSGSKPGTVTGSYKFTTPGIYTLQMNVTDQKGVTTYANTNGDLEALIVIYDPNGGYTVGSGSFPSPKGAIPSKPDLEGNVVFGFQSNYFKGATNPKGETTLGFTVGDFEFNALNFDYLVVQGAKAQFKGSGKIIGDQSGYNFVMTVIDGALDGSGVDKIRMKIYNKNTGEIIYDNEPGISEAVDPTSKADGIIEIGGANPGITGNAVTTREAMQAPVSESHTFNLSAYPNPTTSQFTLQIQSSDLNEKVQVRVYDLSGRTVQQFNNLAPNQSLRIGGMYRPGMYFVEMIQGGQRKQLKIVKQPD